MNITRTSMRLVYAAVAIVAFGWLSVGFAEQVISLDEAVTKVSRETEGRVLVAERTEENERVKYRIKLLTVDGTVKIIFVDPETGRIEN